MTRHVLITGATGTLGHRVVGEATEAGHKVRALSRRGSRRLHRRPLGAGRPAQWRGHRRRAGRHRHHHPLRHPGHPRQGRRLRQQPHPGRAPRRHRPTSSTCSIVGIDRIPMPYYKAKLKVEEALTASGLGHTIIRVTQFHDLIETISRSSASRRAVRDQRCAFSADRHPRLVTHLVSLDRRRARRSRRRHGRSRRLRPRRTRAHVSPRPRQPSACAGAARPRRIVAGLKSGANLVPANPIGSDRLRPSTWRELHDVSCAYLQLRRRLDTDEHSSVAKPIGACCRHRSHAGSAAALRRRRPGHPLDDRIRGRLSKAYAPRPTTNSRA